MNKQNQGHNEAILEKIKGRVESHVRNKDRPEKETLILEKFKNETMAGLKIAHGVTQDELFTGLDNEVERQLEKVFAEQTGGKWKVKRYHYLKQAIKITNNHGVEKSFIIKAGYRKKIGNFIMADVQKTQKTITKLSSANQPYLRLDGAQSDSDYVDIGVADSLGVFGTN